MLASWRVTLTQPLNFSNRPGKRFFCRVNDPQSHANQDDNAENKRKKKIVIVGTGWGGLGAAHHLCNQSFDVTVVDGGNGIGAPDDIGAQGFWYPYRNIFSLVDELGIKPFTGWTRCAQYSEEGFEVEFPVFLDLPQLPTPLGTLYYTQFARLPLLERFSSLLLMAAVIDFDNTDLAWRKYDSITAKELFRQLGCSERLYQNVLCPLLQVGLFAPPEQCSAAATLGLLYFSIVAHQKDFNVAWCRGKVRDKIFEPWMEFLKGKGCEFAQGKAVTGFVFDKESNCITKVICGNDRYDADAVILAVDISTIQEIIKKSAVLCSREEFRKFLYLGAIDMLTVQLKLDKKVAIPYACNAYSGFDDSYGLSFFDLNSLHDEHKDDPTTTVRADFYNANELLPLEDDTVGAKTMSHLSKCVKDFESATVTDMEIRRFPKSLPHFFPGSYKYMMRGSTSFANLFMAGDWIINRHGSWSQEKSYVTGLEAANRVVDYLGGGGFAKIIPVEEDEPHIEALRSLNRRFNEIRDQIPFSTYFMQ